MDKAGFRAAKSPEKFMLLSTPITGSGRPKACNADATNPHIGTSRQPMGKAHPTVPASLATDPGTAISIAARTLDGSTLDAASVITDKTVAIISLVR